MRQICEKIPYINNVNENILSLKKKEVSGLFDALSESDCIIPVGEGRSRCALYIGFQNINKDVKLLEGIDFPGENMFEAASTLEKKYKKVSLFVNSGSGETTNPKRIVEELKKYIDETGSEKFSIDAIVSNPDSTIGKISKKYGNMVRLKGRESVPETTTGYMRHGIMNDIYELGSLILTHKIKKSINQGKNEIFNGIEADMEAIASIVDQFCKSDIYNDIVENIEKRGHVIVGGTGIARIVALMTVIRLQHIKRAIGDEAYLTGPLSPRPRAGDTVLLISWSGENETLLNWMDGSRRFGANTYAITGRESTLSKNVESFVVNSKPTEFYMIAAFVLSPIPLSLVEKLASRGLNLPEYIMGWYHSVTE